MEREHESILEEAKSESTLGVDADKILFTVVGICVEPCPGKGKRTN